MSTSFSPGDSKLANSKTSKHNSQEALNNILQVTFHFIYFEAGQGKKSEVALFR